MSNIIMSEFGKSDHSPSLMLILGMLIVSYIHFRTRPFVLFSYRNVNATTSNVTVFAIWTILIRNFDIFGDRPSGPLGNVSLEHIVYPF